ncbi:unnamed protein product [Bursaphelenchus xylophilus]|nr:unnamed protein product [Bursaphelenchus xylophilus]CAG9099611.1 unnamed protein product [Bursaphelenchus xylophilus]
MDAFWEVVSFWTLQSIILISITFFCGSNKKSKPPATTPNGGIPTAPNQPNPNDPGKKSENVPGKGEEEKKSKKDGDKKENEKKEDKGKKEEMKEQKKENKKDDKDKPRSAVAVPTVRPAPNTDKGGDNEKNLVSNPIVSNVTELYPTVVKNVEDLPIEKTQASVQNSAKK